MFHVLGLTVLLEHWAGNMTCKGTTFREERDKVSIVSEEVKSLEFQVAFGGVPMSGRGENIMIEKWYQALLPVGRLQANRLRFKERLFQCIYFSMVELSPACHSVCHTETKILYVSPLWRQHKFTQTWLTITISLTQHTPLFLFSLVCIVSFLTSFPLPFFPSPSLVRPADFKPWLKMHLPFWRSLFLWDCFSFLHQSVPPQSFPLLLLLMRVGILPHLWYSSVKSKTCWYSN